jgi:hypothetical protein
MAETGRDPGALDPRDPSAVEQPVRAGGRSGGFVGSARDRIKTGGLLGRRTLAAFLLVLGLVCAVAVVWVNALQAQVPRNMPFGVTGASPVVTVAESRKISGYQISFVNTTYANQSAAMDAINEAKIYGAYITGTSSDTLLISQAKSFFAYTEIRPLFTAVAKALGRPLTVSVVKPLPAGKDPVGAVAGTLLTATIVGGMVAAILIFSLTGLAVQRWRTAILLGVTLLAALLTDVIAGPLFGAYAGDKFWPLLPCLWLVTFSTAMVGAALIAVLPAVVALVALEVLFIIVGMCTAGTAGVALLPTYWQSIGAALPPRYGGTLFQNVLYFSSNNITTPIVVLVVYTVIAAAVLGYVEWIRPRKAAVPSEQAQASATGRTGGSRTARAVIAVAVIAMLYQAAFAAAYISAGHNPVSRNMPFAGVGNSSLTSAVEKTGAIKVTGYSDESAAKTAIGQAKAWGSLIPGTGTNRLLTVPSISDLAPYTLPVAFKQAATSQAQTVLPTPYTPTPLAPGDPFGLVLAILLTPLLLFGYQVVTMLKMATKVTAGPLLGVTLMGFAIVATLLIDLIAGPWLGGVPSGKFWILWPIMALIMSVVALFAAVMGRLLGAVGTLLTVFVIILLGKPSSGGANGVPYLPGFWTAIGPYLPPRNAYILMRNTVYFGGNGTTQALIILLAYLLVFATILGILDWYRRPAPQVPEVTPETEALTVAVAIPASTAP